MHSATHTRRSCLTILMVMLSFLVSLGHASEPFSPARVAVYFSPNGGATKAVIHELNAAKTQVLMQAYSFTLAPIAKALINAHKRGAQVLAALDKSHETEKYSAAAFLNNAGSQTLIDDQHAIAHNKVMVIDSAAILTGSFNFTKAAEAKHAENLLVLTDAPELVKAYEQNIHMHGAHSHPYTRPAALVPPAASSTPETGGEVHGNRHSKVYRVPGCKGYAGMNPASVVPFATEGEAQQAGYRKVKDCP